MLADSRALAEDAAGAIEVDYEPLDPLLDARASNVRMSHWHRVSGDVEGAFASAAHVVRASHALPRLAPVPMEPRGAIASYDEADDMLTGGGGNDALNFTGVDPDLARENHRRVNAVIAELAGTYGALVDLHAHFLSGDPTWCTRTIEPSLRGASEIRRCFLPPLLTMVDDHARTSTMGAG